MECTIFDFNIMKVFLGYVTVFLIVSFGLPRVSVGEEMPKVKVEGPEHNIFLGDTEIFTCEASYFPIDVKLEWQFVLQNGISEIVPPADIVEDLQEENPRRRFSYLKVQRKEIESVICYASSIEAGLSVKGNTKVKVTDLQPVSKFGSLCEDNTNTPTVILERFNNNLTSNHWVPHYVNNTNVTLENPVTSLKLTCLSKSDRVHWVVTKKQWYRNWTYTEKEPSNSRRCENCYKVILEIGPVPRSQVYTCISDNNDKYQAKVEIDTRGIKQFDTLEVEKCINLIFDIISGGNGGNGSLTGLSITSSIASLLMLVGIVYFKRQLNKQKDIVKNLVDQEPNTSGNL